MKKSKMILLGFGTPVIQLYNALCKRYNILGVVLDYQRSKDIYKDFYSELSLANLDIIEYQDICNIYVDGYVVINYNKRIDVNDFKDVPIVNIHMGILPKYRGNNANAWAILNGESQVGYTLHQINEEFDAGDIYYVYKCAIGNTYNESKNQIEDHLYKNIAQNILDILLGKLIPMSQKDEEFIYCARLIPEDGVINDWNISVDTMLRRFKIFALPIGTGLWFHFQDNFYCIDELYEIENFAFSEIGFCGAVVNKTYENYIWVKLKDRAVEIRQIHDEKGKIYLPGEIIKIGQRL